MERRVYQRIHAEDVHGLFYPEHEVQGKLAFSASIENISEIGMGVIVTDEQFFAMMQELLVGTRLKFQFVDEYNLYNKEMVDVVEGNASLLRIEKHLDYYKLGCKFSEPNKDLAEYVKNKKVALYMSSL